MLSGPMTRSIVRIRVEELLALLLRHAPGHGEHDVRAARAFSSASVPTWLRSFCSAFSRTLQVLRTMRSASSVMPGRG